MTRPSNRLSSPEILYQSLASSAKILRRTHAAIQKELAAMESELSQPSTTPARKMELLRCIVEIGQELARQCESTAKFITSKPPAGTAADTSTGIPTQEDILLEIKEGVRRARR